ncbi:signal peptide peptidase SppA [Desulfosediminicola ganghwensis]|uniref:signal peptide peptidase SppA n=1 Tax=Desulfosediminicola ganghwensis TaxID=2569540 RepID=UPI0010AD2362|nr:signal peptide peptidase SppA [Desulfosediminicola ganghwensis]
MKDLIKAIANIFKYTGRTISVIRNTLINLVFLFILFVLVVGIFSSDAPQLNDNSLLHLNLSGDIVEEPPTTDALTSAVDSLAGSEQKQRYVLLQDVIDAIETAADDNAITAILLDLKNLGAAGLNQMNTIGEALNAFRQKGKKVYASEDFYTQKQYYLASYADTIIVNPMGGVDLHGFGTYPLYFKEAIDKLKVNYHVFKVGDYKSALEPFTRNSMSEYARSQNSQWLNDLWESFSGSIALQRGFSPEVIPNYIENIATNLAAAGGDTAQLALDNGLVDKVLTHNDFKRFLKKATDNASENLITLNNYLSFVDQSYNSYNNNGDVIGIVVAEGKIVGGNQPAGVIGSESLGKLLRDARENQSVKAVVLRINSGGGSAFASEIIRQEVLELKEAGKPIVVSMGALAASGAYWISADADQIWASPTTLTGSIGIFGAIPTFEDTLAEIGVYSDGVGTTSLSAGLNVTQPLPESLRRSIQLTVENGYERFLSIVENGRGIEQDRMELIAEGRVFSGMKAKEIDLVDELGGLSDAVVAAAELAGLDDYSTVYIKREISVRDKLIKQLTNATISVFPDFFASSFLVNIYRKMQHQVRDLLIMNDPNGIYADSMLQLPE